MAFLPPKLPVAGLEALFGSPQSTSLGEILTAPSKLSLPIGPFTNQLAGLASLSPYSNPWADLIAPSAAPVFPTSQMWNYVRPRFNRFLRNLNVTDDQFRDADTKFRRVIACLNRHYQGVSSETLNGIVIGSWGKLTHNRPPSDVDLIYILPDHVFFRFQQRAGNKQSQLLQEVRSVLADTYTQTRMRGDNQVVVVPFNDIPLEVSPGFRCTDGSIIICNTPEPGRYITSTAEAEKTDIDTWDTYLNGNVRSLARMTKQWKRENNVPLKAFKIERLALEFLLGWKFRHQDQFYWDWMMRDFFEYLVAQANKTIYMPGTGESVALGDEWLFRAQRAHQRAVSACDSEMYSNDRAAGEDWQAIFGAEIPLTVS